MIKKLLLSISLLGALVIFSSGVMDNSGKAGRTLAPGEQSCVSGCHSSFAINSGPGSITLTAPTMTGWQYTPGQVYNMTVTVSQTGVSLFGVDIEALLTSGANGGILGITDVAATHTKTASVNGFSRTNVVHQFNGGANPNSKDFNFKWTAPAAGSGNVTFYFTGNAANGNNSQSGDYIYNSSQIITEACVAPAQPVITSSQSDVDTLNCNSVWPCQWYLNGSIINGAVYTSYVPAQNGTYSVVVTNTGGCSATSTDFSYTTLGIKEATNSNLVSVYPTPASEFITVSVNSRLINSDLTIIDVRGKTIMKKNITNENTRIDLDNISEGVYFAVMGDASSKSVVRFFVSK